MYIKHISWVIGILFISSVGNAQQSNLHTLYNQNIFLVNPAAAGINNCFSAYINHRNQWVGVDDSPTTNTLTVDGRIKNHGLGITLSKDKAGLIDNFNGEFTYAYHLQVSNKSFLHAGAAIGVVQQNFDASSAIASDYSDNLLIQGNQNNIGFNSNVGVMLTSRSITLGLAFPQLFTGGLLVDYGKETKDLNYMNQLNFIASYRLIKSQKWEVIPSVLYRNVEFDRHQIDIASRVMWNNTIGAGVMHRTNNGTMFIVELNLKNQLKVAYSYGFGGNEVTNNSKGTHELMIGIRLCKNSSDDVVVDNTASNDIPADIVVEQKEIIDEIDKSQRTIQDSIKNEIEEIAIIEEVVQENEPVSDLTEKEIERQKIDIDSLNRVYSARDKRLVFAINSSNKNISSNEKDVVRSVVVLLKTYPDLKINLIGHACDLGADGVNQRVSNGRAHHVGQLIQEEGITANRISTIGKGARNPIVPNTTDEGRIQNRRVVVRFYR